MICHLSSKIESDELNNLPLPIFLQYATSSARPVKQLRIKPHGNTTKSIRSFTSTIPQVLENVRVCVLENIYRQKLDVKISILVSAVNKAVKCLPKCSARCCRNKKPNLITVRDRTQVYNALRKDNSITEEYLTVMKRLEKASGVVARFLHESS